MAFDTNLDNTKPLGIDIYIKLEGWAANQSSPVQVVVAGRCSYLERSQSAYLFRWYLHTDCQIHSHIKHKLITQDIDDKFKFDPYGKSNVPSNLVYLVIPNAYRKGAMKVPIIVPDTSALKEINLHLAFYLGKLSEDDMSNGVAVHINDSDQCVLSFPDVLKDPPIWHPSDHTTDCTSSHNMLCSLEPFVPLENKGSIPFSSKSDVGSKYQLQTICGCKSNHFKCNDDTCIMQSRCCDNYMDCPDGTDESHCPPMCNIQLDMNCQTICK